MSNWLRIRKDLRDDPGVMRISDAIGTSVIETIGTLYLVSSYFSVHGKYGLLKGTPDIIDLAVKRDGLAKVLAEVGWLKVHGDVLQLKFFTDVSAGRKALGKAIRKRILEGKTCVACGCATGLVIDHITPVCLGGSSEEENLQPLCSECNKKKGRRTMEEFLRDSRPGLL